MGDYLWAHFKLLKIWGKIYRNYKSYICGIIGFTEAMLLINTQVGRNDIRVTTNAMEQLLKRTLGGWKKKENLENGDEWGHESSKLTG